MVAHVYVVDTPWFGKTGADGVARIERVPPGPYRLRLWHPRQKAAAVGMRVELGDAVGHVGLGLDVTPRPEMTKPPLNGGGY